MSNVTCLQSHSCGGWYYCNFLPCRLKRHPIIIAIFIIITFFHQFTIKSIYHFCFCSEVQMYNSRIFSSTRPCVLLKCTVNSIVHKYTCCTDDKDDYTFIKLKRWNYDDEHEWNESGLIFVKLFFLAVLLIVWLTVKLLNWNRPAALWKVTEISTVVNITHFIQSEEEFALLTFSLEKKLVSLQKIYQAFHSTLLLVVTLHVYFTFWDDEVLRRTKTRDQQQNKKRRIREVYRQKWQEEEGKCYFVFCFSFWCFWHLPNTFVLVGLVFFAK